jgi:hypothetical protein
MRMEISFRRLLRFFGWVWLFGGLVLSAIGIGFGVYNAVFLYRSFAATGTIESLVPVFDQQSGATNYAPVFTFKTPDGHSYAVKADVASNPPGFTMGQTVNVLYLRSDPTTAKLDSFMQLWFMAIILVAVGISLSGMGYLFLRYKRTSQHLRAPAAK